MTLGEFLDTFHVSDDDNVAVFRYDVWDLAPEFGCTVSYLRSQFCTDLLDKEVKGIGSGRELARLELEDEDDNIFEIALDWDGSDHAYD